MAAAAAAAEKVILTDVSISPARARVADNTFAATGRRSQSEGG
jgi:hypothetical protein